MSNKLFVLGAGSMTEAFLRGVFAKHAVHSNDVCVLNRSNSERAMRLQSQYGVRIAKDASEVAHARIIVLSVKPVDAKVALASITPFLHRDQVLVSFAAGIPIDWLATQTEHQVAVIRTMPNLPAAVAMGATAIAYGSDVLPADMEYVRFLLSQVGTVTEMDESLMDAATAFSGSGPGFVCYFLEAMEQAAVHLGFDAEIARELLLQTVVGTAKALQEWELSPHEMRRRVTSQGGTTHAGVTVFEDSCLANVVDKALTAAANRSAEMGKTYRISD